MVSELLKTIGEAVMYTSLLGVLAVPFATNTADYISTHRAITRVEHKHGLEKAKEFATAHSNWVRNNSTYLDTLLHNGSIKAAEDFLRLANDPILRR